MQRRNLPQMRRLSVPRLKQGFLTSTTVFTLGFPTVPASNGQRRGFRRYERLTRIVGELLRG